MSLCSVARQTFLLFSVLLSGIPVVVAQDADSKPAATEISSELIQTKLAAIESATEFDETQRGRIKESYKQTLGELETKATLENALNRIQQEISNIPERLEETREVIEQLSKVTVTLDSDIVDSLKQLGVADQESATWLTMATQTLEQIESRRNENQASLEEARASLATLQGEPKRRADRRVEIPNLIRALQDRIKSVDDEATGNARSDDPPQVTEARRYLLQTRKANAELESGTAKKELELYDASVALLPVRVDSAQRKAIQFEEVVKRYGTEADQLRHRINLMQTRIAAAKRPAELSELAQSYVDLTAKRQEVGAAIQETRQKLETSIKLAKQLREQFDRIQLQIGPASQVTEAVGEILRKNRQDLPNVRKLRDAGATRKSNLYDIRFALIDSEHQLWQLLDLDAKAASELQTLASEVPPKRLQELESDLRDLLQSKKSALEGLRTDLETHYRDLANLDLQEEQIITLAENYAEFIDQRVLWIRSIPAMSVSDIADTGKSIGWLLDRASWTTVLRLFWESGVRRTPLVNVLFFITLLGLAGTRRATKRRIADLGDAAQSLLCCDVRITLRALLQSLLCTALWPIVFAWLAWNLYQIPNGSELVRPLAIACGAITFIVFAFELWRFILKPNGLAEKHFIRPQRQLQLLRTNLRWFMPLWIPTIFFFHVFHATENLVYEKSLARLLFVFACILLAVFIHRLASPKSGLLKEYVLLNRGGWLDQLRWLWFPVLVAMPVAFALLAILGYQYTAAHLLRRFMFSTALLSLVYLGSATGLRWIMLRRRTITIAHMRERKLESALNDTERQTTDSMGGVTLAEGLDLSVVNAQSVRMLRSLGVAASVFGLYLIWASMMPALAPLDNFSLIPSSTTPQPLTGVVAPNNPGVQAVPILPTGVAIVRPISQVDSPIADYFAISLGQLIGAIAVVIVTFIAVQNIPGFMEIVLLERLPLDASLRFAITTVTRYVLVAVGIVWVLGSLGIGWGKIQWLVAALSVGLGFGLQEIFANFVSGLILLFERPLRAGDIVTVGQTSGKVVRINTRATTIRDWDRKELIVPNKDFITGQLLNWTLNDTTHRIVIRVGIAYGSDVKKARDIILAIVHKHSGVLDDPSPIVAFDLFGDSSLNMTLRCFLPNLDQLFPVTHELHEAIHSELRAAGIEIAFPQRDIHVRSLDASLRLNESEADRMIAEGTETEPPSNDA